MKKIRIPLYQPLISKKEIINVNNCLKSSWISSKGKYIKEFEKKFSNYTKINYSTTVINGTAALHLALVSLGIKKGDEVIVPTFTYVATVNPVTYVGAKPVFVDSSRKDWQIDHNLIKKKITKKTKAIICPHLYGQMTNMDELLYLKKKYKLFLIEDCAESLGSFFKFKHAGNFGDVATFSFYGSKTITTGEGGMLCSNNKEVVNRAIKLKLQGLFSEKISYWHDVIGYNYKMTNICAAIGIAQLSRIKSILKKKRNLYFKYLNELKNVPLEFQNESYQTINSFWLVSALTRNKLTRNKLRIFLYNNGVDTRPTFYPIHTMPMYKKITNNHFPIAKNLSSCGINLPSWPDISNRNIYFICNLIKKFFNKK